MTDAKPTAKPENMLLNLVCNILLPTLVLMKLSTEQRLGPLWGLIVALAFPVSYGAYDLATRRKTNFFSVIGFVSVLISGILGLIKADGFWFAVKDGVLPTILGVGVLLSMRTKRPLVREMFYNETFLDLPRVEAALESRGQKPQFEVRLRKASIAMALTILASAPVNFLLARAILTSPPGTPEFNAELGKMHWVAPLVIALPSVAVMMTVFWKLLNGLSELTGLTTDEILKAEKK